MKQNESFNLSENGTKGLTFSWNSTYFWYCAVGLSNCLIQLSSLIDLLFRNRVNTKVYLWLDSHQTYKLKIYDTKRKV